MYAYEHHHESENGHTGDETAQHAAADSADGNLTTLAQLATLHSRIADIEEQLAALHESRHTLVVEQIILQRSIEHAQAAHRAAEAAERRREREANTHTAVFCRILTENGGPMTPLELWNAAIESGHEMPYQCRTGTLLQLRRHGKVIKVGRGQWQIANTTGNGNSEA